MKAALITEEQLRSIIDLGYTHFGVYYHGRSSFNIPYAEDDFPTTFVGHKNYEEAEELNYNTILAAEGIFETIKDMDSIVPIWDEHFLGNLFQIHNESDLVEFTKKGNVL